VGALGMLLLLLGIVKKNSILQVDYANVLRARGLPIREAIVESCRTRLRPILMTTTAIIAGLIPTSPGIGIGGTGRAAIAVTIIGGQSLCLLLTLLLVPVAYVKFDALERAFIGQGVAQQDLRSDVGPSGRQRPTDCADYAISMLKI
jgi:HAE1 family hydrophobic/amphiphilic exporter-1